MFKTLISTDVLASQRDESWTIVDCRYDLRDVPWGALRYQEGHIPGAVYAGLSHHLSSSPTGTNGRHPLPCVEDIEATFGRLGIGDGTQVIAYDQDSGMFASRLWWMLRYLGHDAVAVLDGGWAKWTSEGRPVQPGEEHRPPTVFTARRRKELRVLSDQVRTNLGDGPLLLVDARSPERFEGVVEPIDRIAGHIPGAVNHPHKRNVADGGVLLPVETLREQFADTLGGRSADQVVMYCGSGVTACHNLLAMEYAGFEGGKLYPGSWSEWSTDPTRPVETGPARKP
ncbi:MAG: sulfurtransferase [Acidobacteria bacterium]|nr:sulfurtransferase [Acidobacteriota bacterium]